MGTYESINPILPVKGEIYNIECGEHRFVVETDFDLLKQGKKYHDIKCKHCDEKFEAFYSESRLCSILPIKTYINHSKAGNTGIYCVMDKIGYKYVAPSAFELQFSGSYFLEMGDRTVKFMFDIPSDETARHIDYIVGEDCKLRLCRGKSTYHLISA